MSMNPSRQRLTHWATRGALILATIAIVLGAIFTALISIADGSAPTTVLNWVGLFIRAALIWGSGGLFFGAILGMFASMIWRDAEV
ncbi:MAG: ABC transporter ATP-binding protein [Oscillochloris sp.]|nr:ABC transporter ATP-binding protein [Oscillochloris sp.]